mmetsp:Transcript_3788/g.11088  ORF Transcript_3788/g.11088 Transcript_3788/m.11088 type:complete len:235 (-) Transcript_3788:1825-2529(-)
MRPSSLALSASRLIQCRKTVRNCSTSCSENCSCFMSLCMRNSDFSSVSRFSMRASWTKAQNLMHGEPSSPTSWMPASRAPARAISSFIMRSACACLLLGCQPNSLSKLMSSKLSMWPLLSLSNVSNTSLNFTSSASLKPAFLRSFLTLADLHVSISATSLSKSSLDCSICASRGPSNACSSSASLPSFSKAVTSFAPGMCVFRESAYLLKMSLAFRSSSSRSFRMRLRNSRKSS